MKSQIWLNPNLTMGLGLGIWLNQNTNSGSVQGLNLVWTSTHLNLNNTNAHCVQMNWNVVSTNEGHQFASNPSKAMGSYSILPCMLAYRSEMDCMIRSWCLSVDIRTSRLSILKILYSETDLNLTYLWGRVAYKGCLTHQWKWRWRIQGASSSSNRRRASLRRPATVISTRIGTENRVIYFMCTDSAK